MTRYLCLILGDQLDKNSSLFDDFDPHQDRLWMAEVSSESEQVLSSKQRTVLFLSAMRHFAEWLKNKGWSLSYYSLQQQMPDFASALHDALLQHQPETIRCVLPGDQRVLQAITEVCQTADIELQWLPDRHFLSEAGQFKTWLAERKQPRMEYWYRLLRQQHNILMDDNGKPVGGQWNFDKDNRKAFKSSGPVKLTPPPVFKPDAITQSVIDDVSRYLPELPGKLEAFNWPVTRQQALQSLDYFIAELLPLFGDYQDAMWQHEPFLFHSRLSSSLNLKLLNPHEVIAAAVDAYHEGQAPLNAVEGFIRQILGWREYVRGLYWSYRHDWLKMNALQASRDLPQLYWHANTPMTCLQQSVSQVLTHGYGHHIQRLMVTGLFALLWGVKPQAIHEWYLAMYVDAIAWVEIPNTLGMSQYADGGIVGSKPYIASGAYIDRMSNYCQSCPFNPKQASGDQACPFTTLYWAFVDRHQDLLSRNPRLGMQVKNWRNKSAEEQQAIQQRAQWLYDHIDDLKEARQ